MKINFRFLFFTLFILLLASGYVVYRKTVNRKVDRKVATYTGSRSCKPCHERFYELWAPSHHGLAMQPVTGDFISSENIQSSDDIKVDDSIFKVVTEGDSLVFIETLPGGEQNRYKAVHVLGGKYIYYFLAPFDKGRLHTLPLAYDCDTKLWYNNPESGVRHFETGDDESLPWKSHLYTFNTSCYNCHVSQLESNFDLATLEYNTSWNEPGINCETCHGPSSEHIRVCVEAGEGNVPDDLKIIITGEYTPDQHNSSCGSCHAKGAVIADDYQPGAPYYDYFDLITLENHDFYADGRDLGENYTMTTWAMNKCSAKGDLHCASCHTSSGRYRFAGDNANMACAPCHNDKVSDVSAHSFHKADSEGSKCISCHMPMTSFARMDRSDHSFRPPMPKSSIEFGSPNACNICHSDKSPQWSQKHIEATHRREYQSETIYAGKLIRKARNGDWSDLDLICTGLSENRFDDVYTTSFIRLLENCPDTTKWEAVVGKARHESPLVRSAVAHSLSTMGSETAFNKLMSMVEDEYRLVRLNAAYSLSFYRSAFSNEENRQILQSAMNEYENSMVVNKDDWSSHYNLGNFYSNMGDFDRALESYNNSVRLFPGAVMPMVNAGFLLSLQGKYGEAEKMFEQALSYSPDQEAALLNLALLYGETGQQEKAISYFRRILGLDGQHPVAAYNLSVLLSEDKPAEAVDLITKACEWEPNNQKYLYTKAYFLNKIGEIDKAAAILEQLVSGQSEMVDPYILLANIYKLSGRVEDGRKILNTALKSELFTEDQKDAFVKTLKGFGEG